MKNERNDWDTWVAARVKPIKETPRTDWFCYACTVTLFLFTFLA